VEVEDQDPKTRFRGPGSLRKVVKSSQIRSLGSKRPSRLRQGVLAVLRNRRACTQESRVEMNDASSWSVEGKNQVYLGKLGEVVRGVVYLSHGQQSRKYSQGKVDQTAPRFRTRRGPRIG